MLVFAAIAPHGGDVIAEIAADPTVMRETRRGMEELGKRFREAAPETVVVITPHGAVHSQRITVGVNPIAAGTLGTPPRQIAVTYETDEEFIQRLLGAGGDYVPFVGAEADSNGAGDEFFPLDWGVVVPLWFTSEPMQHKPKLVVLAEDRRLPREVLVRAGVAIARAAEASGKRVALIASCDLGHAHDPNGPYGFDSDSAMHDQAFCEIIAGNDFAPLLDWPDSFLETAKVDAYWQTLMLAGALGHTPMRGTFLSYEAPTYFGMAVAAYSPENTMPKN